MAASGSVVSGRWTSRRMRASTSAGPAVGSTKSEVPQSGWRPASPASGMITRIWLDSPAACRVRHSACALERSLVASISTRSLPESPARLDRSRGTVAVVCARYSSAGRTSFAPPARFVRQASSATLLRRLPLMRKLLIVLLVAAVLVGADFAAARVFESKVATALERKYQLGTRPIVQVRDFPFLPHLLTGRFSALDLAATNARARGLDLDRVEVQLRGVRVPRTVLFGGHGLVRVDQVEGQVELSQAQINRLLAGRLSGGQVTIEANSVRLRVGTEVFGRLVDAVVTGRLGVRDGQLAFRPQSVQVGGVGDPALETTLVSRFTFDVPLPRLPADIQVERVDTEPGAVVLAGGAARLEVAA